MARKAAVTIESVKKALSFLERRREHAAVQENKEWVEEFENAIAVIKELSAYD